MMKPEEIKAALPTSDSPVYNIGAIVSLIITVLLGVLPTVMGDPDTYGIAKEWVKYLQLVFLVLTVLAAKMGDGWAKRSIWTEERRKVEGGQQ